MVLCNFVVLWVVQGITECVSLKWNPQSLHPVIQIISHLSINNQKSRVNNRKNHNTWNLNFFENCSWDFIMRLASTHSNLFLIWTSAHCNTEKLLKLLSSFSMTPPAQFTCINIGATNWIPFSVYTKFWKNFMIFQSNEFLLGIWAYSFRRSVSALRNPSEK